MIRSIAHKSSILFVLGLFFLTPQLIYGSHNSNRYFPFLERSERYSSTHRCFITLDAFYVSASSAYHRDEGSTSLIGLQGPYNMKDLAASFEAIRGAAALQEIVDLVGTKDFINKDTHFTTPGRIRAQGLSISGNYAIAQYPSIHLGFWMPIMHVNTRSRYVVNRGGPDNINKPDIINPEATSRTSLLEQKAQREIHTALGLHDNFSSYGSIGDIDLYAGWSHAIDYRFRMKKIILTAQLGTIIPTAATVHNNSPAQVPVLSDGHWGFYGDLASECELKHDIKVGLILGLTGHTSTTKQRRIAVDNEPNAFSALITNVRTSPGMTFKISPYLIVEHLAPGLHVEARYSYRKHYKDHWHVSSSADCAKSYLTRPQIVADKEWYSEWRSHYISFQLTYDTCDASNNFALSPRFFFLYDYPINGRGLADTHHVTIGAQLHF